MIIELSNAGLHIGFERLWASILLRVGISAYQPSWVVFASVGTISDRFWGVLLVEFSVLAQNKWLSHSTTARFDPSLAEARPVFETASGSRKSTHLVMFIFRLSHTIVRTSGSFDLQHGNRQIHQTFSMVEIPSRSWWTAVHGCSRLRKSSYRTHPPPGKHQPIKQWGIS